MNAVKRSVPELRFSEFQDDWVKKPLFEVCKLKAGKFVAAKNIFDEASDETFPCYGGNGLRGYTKSFTHEGLFPLIGRQGALCGNIQLAHGKFHATEHAVTVTPKKGHTPLYLYYQLDRLHLNRFATGQAQPGLSVDVIERVKANFCSEQEQQKIADFLSSVDKKIEQLTEKHRLLTEYKKGVMQQIFTQQIRFKDDEGNDYPEWKTVKLKKIASFFSGGTPSSTNKKLYLGNIPFVKSGEIASERTEQYITEKALKESSAKMIDVGDILYALYGATSGEVAISKLKGAINQAVLCIRTDQVKSYIFSWLRFSKQRILSTYLQGGQGNLSAQIIKELELPVPSISEQQKIADFLTALDQKIYQVGVELEQTKTFKKGLLQKMFV
ncbi:restriction endonuclease subunit S [Thiomicrorhabdus cannonii]|uniref:restriction endonuclease subunit S n=1 Tax=Thiomicrorhabdus cannonii TaxID=2748011 RepID=UPI0015B7AD05|nr:restriction endonuclease subunit S [Thiomicrorhabdus cannonii]